MKRIVGCKDLVALIIEQKIQSDKTKRKLNRERYNKLLSCCEIIDEFSTQNEVEEIEVEAEDEISIIVKSLDFKITSPDNLIFKLNEEAREIKLLTDDNELTSMIITFDKVWRDSK